jgi:hypothetical protein
MKIKKNTFLLGPRILLSMQILFLDMENKKNQIIDFPFWEGILMVLLDRSEVQSTSIIVLHLFLI